MYAHTINPIKYTYLVKVVTYQSPHGSTINLTPQQAVMLRAAGTWLTDRFGEEYCTVSHGLHYDYATFSDTDIKQALSSTNR